MSSCLIWQSQRLHTKVCCMHLASLHLFLGDCLDSWITGLSSYDTSVHPFQPRYVQLSLAWQQIRSFTRIYLRPHWSPHDRSCSCLPLCRSSFPTLISPASPALLGVAARSLVHKTTCQTSLFFAVPSISLISAFLSITTYPAPPGITMRSPFQFTMICFALSSSPASSSAERPRARPTCNSA